MSATSGRRWPTRRRVLALGAAAAGAGTAAALGGRVLRALDRVTTVRSFTATPRLLPHDPARDATRIAVARGRGPRHNVVDALDRLGGLAQRFGPDDVVAVKVSAQWWETGMTNVAAVQAAIEALLDLHGAAFRGEIVVVENTHFRFPDRAEGDPDAGLTRAWTHPSRWNVDVQGMTRLLDLREHFRRRGAPVSFVGLVDAGPSALASSPWHDPEHVHGEYGGDGRGPLRPGDLRDGYHWALDDLHRVRRSWVAEARVPLSWPRFTSPATGRVLDLRGGVLRRDGGRLVADDRRLRLLTMTTANEHGATGITGACKSAMGLVDMSAGALGTHPLVAGLQSVHYAGRLPGQPGERSPLWRMAGPLARFGQRVRRPDLYLTVAEWVAVTPATGFDARAEDLRHSPACAVRAGTVIAGDDPVAIDAWAVRHLLHPAAGAHAAALDLDDADSTVSRFLRCFRLETGHGTLDPALVEVA